MSWSDAAANALKPLLFISLLLVLAGCSGFRPVYGDPATDARQYAFAYAEPASRLDQIIYTELRLRLGPPSTDPDAIRVAVSTTSGARGLTRTAVAKPMTNLEMLVSTAISVTRADGTVLFTGTRSTSAFYTSAGQVLADVAAQTEAAERGAKALADSVRLTILGAVSKTQ
jgi:LPS-assembly lipoprotein